MADKQLNKIKPTLWEWGRKMETLDNLIEKVLTLNVNANTNIDVQAIIEKYVLYTQLGRVLITLLICGTIFFIAFLSYRAYLKTFKVAELGKEIDKVIEKMQEYSKYEIKDLLKEILEFMPRNKKKRKLNND